MVTTIDREQMNRQIFYFVFNLCFATLFSATTNIEAVAEIGDLAKIDRISIETKAGESITFYVEIAADSESRKNGLMFRRELNEDAGMLFDFQRDQPVIFWMRNTYIPLDLFFVSSTGRIVGVVQRLVPLSDTPIPSPLPVRAVLETNAGVADRYNIQKGDVIRHQIFRNAQQ